MSSVKSTWTSFPFLLSWISLCAFSEDVELPATCIDLEDGYHWLKPLDGEDYPAIKQLCSNGYMMIDHKYDPNVQEYFSSFTSWHYALSGPEQMDPANWEDWWLPNAQFLESHGDQGAADPDPVDQEQYFSYILSPECDDCNIEANGYPNNLYYLSNDDSYGDRTAYYMTGTLFGCLTKHKAMKDCRWDYETYTCNYCTKRGTDLDLGYHVIRPQRSQDYRGWNNWFKDLDKDNRTYKDLQIGICGVYPQSTYNNRVPRTRAACNQFEQNIKPSLGTDGRHCQCVKPHKSYDSSTAFTVPLEELEALKDNWSSSQNEEDDDDEAEDGIIELYQSHFEEGTYRIEKAGYYKIMEDIEFDFNPGDGDDPNTGVSWWPKDEQREKYPGAGETMGNYYLGFIAGITVEVDNVTIDLNGYEIKMSHALYYQQRFFSCIALKSVAFPLNQGPGNFGFSPKYANNVLIKDGVIGLTSHHGIHGHFNENVTISNVHVHSFETHGIQMSYFKHLKIENVEIGPSSKIAFLKGEYAYARWTIQAFDRIRETDYNVNLFPVQFANRERALSLDEVIERLRDLMDIAFKHVMGTEVHDDDDDDADWIAARDLFINEDGLPYGAVMYGLFLNLYFSNVFTIHPSTKHSHDAEISNVSIHGLHHKTVEYLRMDKYGQAMFRNQFNAPLDARAVLGDQVEVGADDIVWSEVEYQGTPLSDAEILLSLVTDDWGERGLLLITKNYSDWAFGEYQWNDDDDDKNGHPWLGCNNDRMAHVPKGVIGVRMDGVEDVRFSDLDIYDVHEFGEMGSDLCGEYWDQEWLQFQGKGNPLQNSPYLYGYTGNRAHGLFSDWADFSLEGNVNIHDISCDTGLVRGIGMYTSSKVRFIDTKLKIHNLAAGAQLGDIDTSALPHPYNPAVAKPFHIVWSEEMDDFPDEEWKSFVVGNTEATFSCVVGRDGMEDDDFKAAHVVNDGCYDNGEGTYEAYQRMMNKDQTGISSNARSPLSLDSLLSASHGVGSYMRQMVWTLSALVAVVVIGSILYLWETKVHGRRSSKVSDIGQDAGSNNSGKSEAEPLIARHFNALRYL